MLILRFACPESRNKSRFLNILRADINTRNHHTLYDKEIRKFIERPYLNGIDIHSIIRGFKTDVIGPQ